ncbi:MAG: PhzF family phenazine biosynthesis protein [Vicinamibacterales bacterium]
MPTLPLYQIDAFTSRVFAGNPAAVVLLDDWLPDATMAAIAAENNLAETAFVIPRAGCSPLRWFTPAVEIDLCGHATLATAHVLFEQAFPDATRLEFETKSGRLAVGREGARLVLDFPARPGARVSVDPAVAATFGVEVLEAHAARDLMVIVHDEDVVRSLQPDMARIAALDAFAIIVTAPGREVDFVSRFFAPRAGIPEDPVTGSAHCTLTPYWAARLGRSTLTARQLSPRGGELECTLRGDRVLIAGHTVEYLRGRITVP